MCFDLRTLYGGVGWRWVATSSTTSRAYEWFRTEQNDDSLANRRTAEHELVWQPEVELCEKYGEFQLPVAVRGVEWAGLEGHITPDAC